MLHRIHQKLGTAGVLIAVVALVAALGGTALAASGALTSKQKKEVKAIAKSFQGTGPAGAPGANGTNGANGAKGENGAPGSPGANGKTVLHGSETPPSSSIGTEGDFYINTATDEIYGPRAAGSGAGVWGSPTELKGEQGEPGEPWPMGGTLPSEKSEYGVWTFGEAETAEEVYHRIPISFTIPMPSSLSASNAHYIVENGKELVLEGFSYVEKTRSAACPGTFEAPSAQPGNLCVYASWTGRGSIELGFNPFEDPEAGEEQPGVGKTGFVLNLYGETKDLLAQGVWVVTAP